MSCFLILDLEGAGQYSWLSVRRSLFLAIDLWQDFVAQELPHLLGAALPSIYACFLFLSFLCSGVRSFNIIPSFILEDAFPDMYLALSSEYFLWALLANTILMAYFVKGVYVPV